MKHLDCIRAMSLAERAGAERSDAERLRLEDHLERCESCAAEIRLLRAAALQLRESPTLEQSTRERILRRAFAARSGEKPVQAMGTTSWSSLGLRGLALAATVVLLAFGTFAAFRLAVPKRAAVLTEAPVSKSPSEPGSPRPPEETGLAGPLSLEADEQLELAGTRVTALRAGTLVVSDDASEIRLLAGAMRFEVEPGRATPFRVFTSEYEVVVLGTIFSVDGSEVLVERGRVRVTSPTHGSVELTAGQLVQVGEAALEQTPTTDLATDSTATARPTLSPVAAQAILAQARKQLAAGNASSARSLVQRVLLARPSPSTEAEAQTLLAECALVAGDHEEAARRYAEVAKRHPDQPAGETALFASAREAHASGQHAEAKRRFQQYLAHYPNGQFVQEARARLSQLSP